MNTYPCALYVTIDTENTFCPMALYIMKAPLRIGMRKH